MTNISFTFDFFLSEFVDLLNPVMGIDILIEKLDSEMSGPNMWHFVYVLKSILFDRGVKADEIQLIEKQRQNLMHQKTNDLIRQLIEYVIGQNQDYQQARKNIINKKIQYTIIKGEFKLFNVSRPS